ncbi:MAG: zinc-ribbon domain-containing protein [Candidatus Hodarchaeota archaeon]
MDNITVVFRTGVGAYETCKNCGNEVDAEAVYCRHCGKRID